MTPEAPPPTPHSPEAGAAEGTAAGAAEGTAAGAAEGTAGGAAEGTAGGAAEGTAAGAAAGTGETKKTVINNSHKSGKRSKNASITKI